MKTSPGTISSRPENGFSAIPLQVAAIGHIGVGPGSVLGAAMVPLPFAAMDVGIMLSVPGGWILRPDKRQGPLYPVTS
jgi:hypothetical protein